METTNFKCLFWKVYLDFNSINRLRKGNFTLLNGRSK